MTAYANKAKKIFFTCYSYWDLYNFRIDILKYFLDEGYEVHTVAINDQFAQRIEGIGCKTHFVKFNNRGMNPVRDAIFLSQLKKIYKTEKPDLIFHYAIKPNIYGSMAASQLKIPSISVITGLGYAFASNNWLLLIATRLYRYALKHVKFVVLLNEEDKLVFLKRKIIEANKAVIFYSEGINTKKFITAGKHHNNKAFTFLMATRMLWSKGVGLYAQASEILKAKGLNFESKIAGVFENEHPDVVPQKQIEGWQKNSILNYMGFCENMLAVFDSVDCFVLPSYYNEGVPRSLLEACSMQVPAITTGNNGCKEVIIDDVNGFICNKNDVNDLADKMEKMLHQSTQALENMGMNSRKLVEEKFDINLVINKYKELLDRLKL